MARGRFYATPVSISRNVQSEVASRRRIHCTLNHGEIQHFSSMARFIMAVAPSGEPSETTAGVADALEHGEVPR